MAAGMMERSTKGAQELLKTYRSISQELEMVGRAVWVDFEPAVNSAAKIVLSWVDANEKWFRSEISGSITALATALGKIDWGPFKLLGSDFAIGAKDELQLLKDFFLGNDEVMLADWKRFTADLEKYYRDVISYISGSGPDAQKAFERAFTGAFHWFIDQTNQLSRLFFGRTFFNQDGNLNNGPGAAPAGASPPAADNGAPPGGGGLGLRSHRGGTPEGGSGPSHRGDQPTLRPDRSSYESGDVGDARRLGAAPAGSATTGDEGYRRVYEAAKKMGDTHPDVTAAQWALESDWGRKPSGKNNYFGQKARRSEAGTARSTLESFGGRMVRTSARFKDYESLEDSVGDHVQRWSRRYAGAGSDEEAVRELQRNGYATDPNYVGKIMATIRRGKSKLSGGEFYPGAGAAGSTEGPTKLGGDGTVLGGLQDARRRGLITDEQCVTAAMASVGIRKGAGAGGNVHDWRKGASAESGDLVKGTPVSTFLDRQGRETSRYAGGGSGTPKAGLDHAGTFDHYTYGPGGKRTGFVMAEQYQGSGGVHMKQYSFGSGYGERNGSHYHAVQTPDGRYLGGDNNPMNRPSAVAAKPSAPAPRPPKQPSMLSAMWHGIPGAADHSHSLSRMAMAGSVHHHHVDNSRTASTHIGTVHVQTAATDGRSFVDDLHRDLQRRGVTDHSDYGLA